MSLKETLLQDLKVAMKEKDTIRKNTIQLVRAGVLQIEKDNHVELDDEGVLDVVAKELKKRRDSLPEFEKSGRTDLIDNLTEDEIKKIVEETIAETGASSMKDMGKVMGAVSPKVKGRADNRVVSGYVKELLSKK